MIKLGSLLVGAMLTLLLIPSGQVHAGTIRLLHIDLSYPGSAVAYHLYKNGELVCVSAAPSASPIECAVEIDAVPMTFVLTAVDETGMESPQSAPYILTPPTTPTATFIAMSAFGAGPTTVGFDASDAYDPDGILTDYVWDFGDGSTGTGKLIDHTYASPGVYVIRLTVSDDNRNSAETAMPVIVTPPPPLAVRKTISVWEDRRKKGIVTAVSEFDAPITFALASPPSHGRITFFDPNTGLFTYKPQRNYYGFDRFTFTANDGTGASAPAAIRIKVHSVNDAPKAVTDFATVKCNDSITLTVLANDTDVEGDPLALLSVAQPGAGTAELAESMIRYSAPSVPGTVSFTYQISDGKGGIATGTITIAVLE